MEKRKLIALLVIMISMLSCFDTDLIDPDKIDTENIELTPKMIFPVVTADITMEDVLTGNSGDETEIISDAEGNISMMYTQDSIAEFSSSEIFEFPPSNPPVEETITIPEIIKLLGTISVPDEGQELGSIEAAVEVDPGEEDVILSELSADFDIAIDITPQPFKYELKIEFENEGLADKIFIVNRNEPLSEVMTFSSIKFDITDPAKKNAIILNSTITVLNDGQDVDFGALTDIGLSFTMENFIFNSVKGDFGKMEIDFPADSFDLEVEGTDFISGSVIFNNPKLSLVIDNNDIGTPFSVDLDLIAKKNADLVSIKRGPDDILQAEGADVIGVKKIESLSYTKENSNIVDFFATFPMQEILYSGKLILNPSSVDIDTKPNFITKDASLVVNMKMELPMDFTLENFTYEETLDDLDIDIDTKTKEKIVDARLIIKADNEWPLGVSIDKISLQDEDGTELSSITGGDIIKVEQKSRDKYNSIELNHDVINSLDAVKNIVLKIIIDSKEGGAKLNNNEKLNFTMAVEANLDLSLSSDNN